jgi:hypothetical protein
MLVNVTSWPPPQHQQQPDPEPPSAEDLLAEQVEAEVRYQFRTATNAQVDAVTRGVRKAAIQFAEAWSRQHPRRMIPR